MEQPATSVIPSPPPTAIAAALRASPVLALLSGPAAADLARVARVERLDRGVDLWRPGEPVPTVWLVVRGLVRVAWLASDQAKNFAAVHGPGELVASDADMGPAHARAHTVTEAELVAIPRAALRAALGRSPDAALALADANARRVDELVETSLARLEGAEPALARAIRNLIAHAATNVLPRMTNRELSALAGTTPETTSRVLTRWTREGLITIRDDGSWWVPDLIALDHLARRG